MDSSSSQDKSQPATQRKLKKAREEGQVARSRDLAHLASLGTGGVALVAGMPMVIDHLRSTLASGYRFDASYLANPRAMTALLGDLGLQGLMIILPFALLIMLAGIGASLAVGGWTFTLTPVMPAFSKINPLSGLGRMFSRRQLVETTKLVAMAALLCTVAWFYLSDHMPEFAHGLTVALPKSLAHSGAVLTSGGILLLLIVALAAAIDGPLQKFMHLNKLKMSHEEVKQENKESNGNPQLKGRLRARAREISGRRMMAAVPQADLIVMNPTHYAVALRYDDATMKAPQVIAKGIDLMAMRIRKLGQEHQVPVLESPRLARALYAHANVDQEIPSSLYTAVAQVLAYVYQLRAAMASGTPVPPGQPDPFVPPELDPLVKKSTEGIR
jgi:flagellar biosynthetic protein FlhB